jgi:hypothetical protein
LSDDHTAQILAAVANQKEDNKIEKIFSLGKLVSLDWNVKNHIGSKDMNSINRLFVDLVFKIQKNNLAIESHSISLSLPEFKVISSEILIIETYIPGKRNEK